MHGQWHVNGLLVFTMLGGRYGNLHYRGWHNYLDNSVTASPFQLDSGLTR